MTPRLTFALALAGLVAAGAPAHAYYVRNSLAVNGIRLNGVHMNGIRLNGLNMNGLPRNDAASNPRVGASALGELNGVAIEGVTLPNALER